MRGRTLTYLLVSGFVCIVTFFLGRLSTTTSSTVFSLMPTPVPTPLAKYTIPNLKTKSIRPALFERGEGTSFTMTFDPTLSGAGTKKASGVVNIPVKEGKFPLIVMVRGYVDPKIYTPGVGSQPAANVFVKSGFITVAPDFLGYGSSDSEAGDIFESRFQTYTTLGTLLNSIATPSFDEMLNNKWDGKNIFIWAHSNGGQVALSTLSVTGLTYPTVLWAPVSKPFPYSVLYYTDESPDSGKFIRRELAYFETLYDVNDFSFTNFEADIKAPFEIEQGTADSAVPFTWTRALVKRLKAQGNEVVYNEYPGSDHNLRPAWNKVVARDIEFYKKQMK